MTRADMASNSTTASTSDNSSATLLLWIIGTVLILSLCCNIICCVSRYYSGKGICQPRKRERQTQMEDNPIYGNISYMQTSTTLFSEADPSNSRDQPRVNSDSQSKTQECYANLTLKAPRVQSGRSSQCSAVQYSDVVQFEETLELEKEDEGNTDTISTMSDLYASVQTQRVKTIHTAEGGEDYANHL